MRRKCVTLVALASMVWLVAGGGAGAAAPQYGAKCNAAWSGKRGTHDYRAYKKGCMAAAIAATRAARTAGDSDDDAANTSRAVAACREQIPPPRRQTRHALGIARACW